jgi:hypothetical protein
LKEIKTMRLRKLLTRALCALALLCVLSTSALAIDVTIGAADFPNYNYSGSTAKLRIYPSQTFTASDSTTVPGGTTPGATTGFFTTVNCTVASTTLHCNSVTLKSTTDALVGADTTYTVKLFDAAGTARDFFPLSDFVLYHTLGATVTWSDVSISNSTHARAPAPGYYDSGQTDSRINSAVNVGNAATTGAIGRVRLHSAPTDATAPEVVVTEDPRLPATASVVFADRYATLALAAATPAGSTLVVTSALTVSASLSVSSNVCVGIEGAGSISVASGQTLTLGCFVGPPRQVFSGSGSVVFASGAAIGPGNAVEAVWFAGDFGQRVTKAKTAVPSEGGEVDAATGLGGAQSLSSTLTLDKAYVHYSLAYTLSLSMSANPMNVPVGVHGVHLRGGGSGAYNSRANSGTTLTFTGTGNTPAILVGDSSAQTDDFQMTGIHLVVSNSTGAGLKLVNSRLARIIANKIVGATINTMTTTAGINLSGGAGTGTTYGGIGVIEGNEVGHFQYGIFIGGDAADSSNVYWIYNNNLHGYGTTGGLVGGGSMTYGMYIGAQDSTHLDVDVEGMGTGLYLAANASRVVGNVHCDSCGTYTVDADAASFGNILTVTWSNGGALHNQSAANSIDDGSIKTGNDGTAGYIKSAPPLPLRIFTPSDVYAIQVTDTEVGFNIPVKVKAVAFSALPASPSEGMMMRVTDSTTATWGAVIAGGGSNHVTAIYTGTAWTVFGK